MCCFSKQCVCAYQFEQSGWFRDVTWTISSCPLARRCAENLCIRFAQRIMGLESQKSVRWRETAANNGHIFTITTVLLYNSSWRDCIGGFRPRRIKVRALQTYFSSKKCRTKRGLKGVERSRKENVVSSPFPKQGFKLSKYINISHCLQENSTIPKLSVGTYILKALWDMWDLRLLKILSSLSMKMLLHHHHHHLSHSFPL